MSVRKSWSASVVWSALGGGVRGGSETALSSLLAGTDTTWEIVQPPRCLAGTVVASETCALAHLWPRLRRYTPVAAAGRLAAPRSWTRMHETVVCHRDPLRAAGRRGSTLCARPRMAVLSSRRERPTLALVFASVRLPDLGIPQLWKEEIG